MNALRYVAQHKPTAKFVELYTIQGDPDHTLYMRFVNDPRIECLYYSKEALENDLKNAIDDNSDLYGRENFLEFEFRSMKITMSFLT